jgi:hypothetical protein
MYGRAEMKFAAMWASIWSNAPGKAGPHPRTLPSMKHDPTILRLVATMEYGNQPTVCMAQVRGTL